MLINNMQITKHVESLVQKEYFFIKGKIKINPEYFISKIEEGIQSKDNLNFKTNVLGSMTRWDFFNKDPEFQKIIIQLINYVEQKNLATGRYKLKDAWGIKEGYGDRTLEHNHSKDLFSGIVYLNDIDSPLIFPQIKETIYPEVGGFAVFSGFLNHKTEGRILEFKNKYAVVFNVSEVVDY